MELGLKRGLEVHHITPRSRLGHDAEKSLTKTSHAG